MAFTERHEHKIEVLPPYSVLQCRRADIIEKDGVEVGKTYHRHVRVPGDDMTDECPEMQAISAALWTPEVIAAYQDSQVDREGLVRARNEDGTFKADDPATPDVDEAWKIPKPVVVPRWVDFSAAIMGLPAINVMLGAVLQAAPGLYGGLIVGLQNASEGDSRVFLNSWNASLFMGLLTADLISTVQEIAAQYDLPVEFIDALSPVE